MVPIKDFDAQRVREPTNEQVPLVQLSFRGRAVDGAVPGALLEHQFHVNDGRYLLLLTDDVPFEETLRIYLFSANLELLDGLEIGAPYATGHLDGVETKDDRTVEFSFIHKGRCLVSIDSAGRRILPLRFVPGVTRLAPWHRKRYLHFTLLPS